MSTEPSEFMKNLLLNKNSLPLKKVALVRNGDFLRVRGFNPVSFMPVKISTVEEIASKGCGAFIDYYFDKNLMIKGNVGQEEINAVVNKLFEWKIPSFVSDYPGVLVIADKNFKCP